jgi:hypothetical protein
MSDNGRKGRKHLTDYEVEQVERIAAWKSEAPNPLAEIWKTITVPGAKVLEKVIPNRLVEMAIEKVDDAADLMAGQEDIKRRAGVQELAELRNRPLEECDGMARQSGLGAQVLATAEGAATGAGGVWTTLLDVPLLFTLALRTIRKVGHCYGYTLEGNRGRAYVLAVLVAALAGSLELRRRRLRRLREIEDLLIEETEEDIIIEEIVSFVFQLEVFEDVPGLGAISGAALNVALMNRVDRTARRVFQERWLRDNGKVREIAPAEAHPRILAPGLAGAVGRLAYSGCYAVGFGAALPVYAAAAVIGPMNGALTRGIRDGANSAGRGVEWSVDRARAATASVIPGRRMARTVPSPA